MKAFAGATPDPTYPPLVRGDSVRIERGGERFEVGSGYRQAGVITRVHDGTVVQRTRDGEVKYELDDLLKRSLHPDRLLRDLQPGKNVDITLDATTVDTRQIVAHDRHLGHERGLSHGLSR